MDEFNYALIYNNQALDEFGFTTELMSKGHYYPSEKAQKYVDKLFSNQKLPLAMREKYWDKPTNRRTIASIFARIYAVYVENPQYFGDSPLTAVKSSLLSARGLLFHFQKKDGDKYYRISNKFIVSISDSFHESIYPDSLTLISLKKPVSHQTQYSPDSLWGKVFAQTEHSHLVAGCQS